MPNKYTLIFDNGFPHPNRVIVSLEKLTGLSFLITDTDENEITFSEKDEVQETLFFIESPLFDEDIFVEYFEGKVYVTIMALLPATYLFLATVNVLIDLGGNLKYSDKISIPNWSKEKWEIARNMDGVKFIPKEK